MIYEKNDGEGSSYEIPVSCLKYSRVSQRWVIFSKKITKRKPIPITNEDAILLLRQGGITRHDKGDYVLFQVNANAMFTDPSRKKDDFDISTLL